jgi:hypothetical protein
MPLSALQKLKKLTPKWQNYEKLSKEEKVNRNFFMQRKLKKARHGYG